MTLQRRFLPSISCLMALEAVDRLGSAVAAAEDLSLTHSAVSRQLKVLEEQIGLSLLVRDGKGLRLTHAGRDYARSVRDCLHDLSQASLRLRAAGDGNSLDLALPPTFGLYWMGPRLFAFMRENSDILVNQSTRMDQFDFSREKFDAAIHYGTRDWPGVHYLELSRDRLVPVAAPTLVPDGPLEARSLLSLPLLHLESRPGAWESWFADQGATPAHLRGMLFDQFFALAEATAAGFGVALLPDFLAQKEISAGRLVQAGSDFLEPAGRYYLVWPRNTDPKPALERLIDWLKIDKNQ